LPLLPLVVVVPDGLTLLLVAVLLLGDPEPEPPEPPLALVLAGGVPGALTSKVPLVA